MVKTQGGGGGRRWGSSSCDQLDIKHQAAIFLNSIFLIKLAEGNFELLQPLVNETNLFLLCKDIGVVSLSDEWWVRKTHESLDLSTYEETQETL